MKQKQHYRIIKTKQGRRRILVNRGVKRKRYSDTQYKYSRGVIKNKRQENISLASEYGRLQTRRNQEDFGKRIAIDNRLSNIKRRVASNSEDIDHLNKTFFPKNQS